MGNKARPLRWTANQASSEFGVDRRVVASNLRTANCEPGPDGKYSSRQIAAAIFGDIKHERLRKMREDADSVALKNRERRGQLIETRLAAKAWEQIILTARLRILGLGAKVESQYVVGMDQGGLRDLIENETRQMLEDLSKPIDYSKLTNDSVAGEPDDEYMEAPPEAED